MQPLAMHIKLPAYEIPCYFGENLWESLLRYLQVHFPDFALFVISDSHVAELYKGVVQEKLGAHSGFRGVLTFPAGEANKSRRQKEKLEDALLAQKAGRDTVIVAMGGGVTGDLAGYVAATLLRGVPLVHLPTSLLAQVDSSIGGKTGVNHPAGKNLIGAFYQPQAIFCDVNFIDTLPDDEFSSGMGEVIKYAVTLDDELWQWLEKKRQAILDREHRTLQKVIERCARLKIGIAESDEKEAGLRSILNFGHTVGHAIEQLSKYRLKHGFAVAAGMFVAAKLSERYLNYPKERVERLENLLQSYHLNHVDFSAFTINEIWESMLSDKKTRQQIPRFSLMNASNQPELFYPIEKRELENVLGSI